jgi:ABC-2 type transport system permease protein
MTTLTASPVRSFAVRDSLTMLRRNIKHAKRYPSMTLAGIMLPVFMLLLFVGVFGGALGSGIGTAGGDYVNYVTPAIILMAATSGSIAAAVSVASDMAEGIINRFRTMAIARSSVLIGHVIGSVLQTLLSVALVTGVAVAMGFRPNATLLEWIAAAGLLVLLMVALTWIAAAMGLVAKNVESASNLPLPFTFLPLLGSGFVPTDSMPAAVRWFAEYQPFTPINETLRGLLMGTPIGNNAIIAAGWCAALTVVGFLWARRAFDRTREQI